MVILYPKTSWINDIADAENEIVVYNECEFISPLTLMYGKSQTEYRQKNLCELIFSNFMNPNH